MKRPVRLLTAPSHKSRHEARRSSRLRSSPSSKLDIAASLLGTAVGSSARLESVARIENTVVDVYYRIDSMKSDEWLAGSVFRVWGVGSAHKVDISKSRRSGGGKYLCEKNWELGPMLRTDWCAQDRADDKEITVNPGKGTGKASGSSKLFAAENFIL